MARNRKAPKPKPAKVDSDSEIEEIPRKTLVEQIEAQYPHFEAGKPFNIANLKAPLADALAADGKQGVSYNEYHIPSGTVKPINPEVKNQDNQKDTEDDGEPLIGDLGQTFFFAVPLTMLLLGFNIVVERQYLERPSFFDAIIRSLKAFLPIWFILYISHPRKQSVVAQVAFFATAVGAGCWLIYNVNRNGYFAVMRRAPPLGTMLIYCVIEMDLLPAVGSLVCIISYVWYTGYSLV